jgi:hypothetical protein
MAPDCRAPRSQHAAIRGRAGGNRSPSPGPVVEEAADVIWATNSAEFYVLLVHERGWSAERYARWLADTWRRLLLQPE